jgi:hypothetical protein
MLCGRQTIGGGPGYSREAAVPCYEPSMPAAPKHPLRITTPADGDNGPTYSYRGAVIVTNKQETNCSFSLEGFPHGANGRWGGIGAFR